MSLIKAFRLKKSKSSRDRYSDNKNNTIMLVRNTGRPVFFLSKNNKNEIVLKKYRQNSKKSQQLNSRRVIKEQLNHS